MKMRLISAGVGIVIAISVIVFGEMNSIVIAIAASVVSTIIAGEYLSARKLHKEYCLFIPSLIFAFLIPILSYTAVGFIPAYLFILYICIISVLCYKTINVGDILFTVAGVYLMSMSMAMFAIRSCAENRFAAFWVIFILGVPWIADSGAFFIGRSFGKHKLAPEISPKKTIEGAVGGVLCATIVPLLIGLVFQLIYGNVTINYGILPLIGFVNALISILGDLLFSVIKRGCGIKDYGTIMPGHGGLLDRFDSVILCVPVVYFISHYVTIIA